MTQEPDSKPKLTLEEQISSIVLKTIKTAGIAGGGGHALWLLIKDSDIPRTLASAVIGTGLSYGAKMLMPIHKGNEERAEKFGQALNQGVEQISENIVTTWQSLDFTSN